MEYIEINCESRIFKIKRKVAEYVLYRLSGKDFTDKDSEQILKAMKKYKLIDKITLESMTLTNKNKQY